MKKSIDLNCDLGEGVGVEQEIMPYISSANISCGFHAGTPQTLRTTVQLAILHGVSLGAHPSFNDREGFGRRLIQTTPEAVYAEVLYQIGALDAIIRSEGGVMNHVKPHGALYNLCAYDYAFADAVAEAVCKVNPQLKLYGLSGSVLIKAGQSKGLQTVNEVFADRTYLNNGTLVPRSQPGSCIEHERHALEQVLEMVLFHQVTTIEHNKIPIQPDSVCLHGDGIQAVRFAKLLRQSLEENGITIGKT